KLTLPCFTQPNNVRLIFLRVDLEQRPGRNFVKQRIRIKQLRDQIKFEIINAQQTDLEKNTCFCPPVRLREIAINQELQYKAGIELDPRIKIFQPTDALAVTQIIQKRDNALFQLIRKEDVQQFNCVRDALSSPAVDVFFHKLNRACIIQHRKQHINVLNVVLNFIAERFPDIIRKAFLAYFMNGTKVPADIGDIRFDCVLDTRD